jgi:hypothetical protein
MKKSSPLPTGFAVALASLLAASASAQDAPQNIHSWVSSMGTGLACTRAAPCASFATAQNATVPGGVVSVLDSGDYGPPFIITKPLTIRAEGVDGGSIVNSGTGFLISVTAGASDVVTLEGLHFSRAGGVQFNSGGQLHLVRCSFAGGTAGFAGISFQPNGRSKLSVTDTVISNMSSGGIVINPRSGGSALVNLERVTVNGNNFGIRVDGTGSTAGINMTIANSMIGGNSVDGIFATTPGGGPRIQILVKNTASVNNDFGIRSVGQGVTVRVSNSTVTSNRTGLSFSGGGALLSFGNNEVQANGANGAFSGSAALQ